MNIDIPIPTQTDPAYLVLVVIDPRTGKYAQRVVLPELVRDSAEGSQLALRQLVDKVVA